MYLDVYTVPFAVGQSLAEAAIVVAVADAVLEELELTGDWGDALVDESVHLLVPNSHVSSVVGMVYVIVVVAAAGLLFFAAAETPAATPTTAATTIIPTRRNRPQVLFLPMPSIVLCLSDGDSP